jgi:hypothetical protein
LSLGVKRRKWLSTSHRLACTGHGGTIHQPGLSVFGIPVVDSLDGGLWEARGFRRVEVHGVVPP